jgi:phosphoribosylformylglycinamidine (FGAM) synthase-like enzyme
LLSPNGAGANVRVEDSDGAAELALFGESGARCVVSLAPAKLAALQGIARQYGVAASGIGQVTQDPSLRIEYKGRAMIDCPVENLRDVWANSLERTIAERTK